MYLVDTNVWLELLLEQEKSPEVHRFLRSAPPDRIFITDFAFHSIGVVLSKLQRSEVLLRFVHDLFIEGAVSLIRLEPEDSKLIVGAMRRFNLDFDDAYQYVAAEKYNLEILSFDTAFDRTEKGRKGPGHR